MIRIPAFPHASEQTSLDKLRGLGIITGQSGTGKSWLARYGVALARDTRRQPRWEHVWLVRFSNEPLWDGLAHDLGVPEEDVSGGESPPTARRGIWQVDASGDRTKRSGSFTTGFASQIEARGNRKLLVIIDELQLLRQEGGSAAQIWHAARRRGASCLFIAQEDNEMKSNGVDWQSADFTLSGKQSHFPGGNCGHTLDELRTLTPGSFLLRRRRLLRGLGSSEIMPPLLPSQAAWTNALRRALTSSPHESLSLIRLLPENKQGWLEALDRSDIALMMRSSSAELRMLGIRLFGLLGPQPF